MAGTLSATISLGNETAPQFAGGSALAADAFQRFAMAASGLAGSGSLDALFRPQFARTAPHTGLGVLTMPYAQKYAPTALLAASGALSAVLVGTITGITFVGGNASTGNTASMPAHQTGDLILAFAFRDGSSTAPGTPGGYLTATIEGGFGENKSGRIAIKLAQSSSETTGAFSNATGVAIAVYRNAFLMAGTSRVAEFNEDSGTTITYPASPLLGLYNPGTPVLDYGGTGWIICAAGHRSASNLLTTTPSPFVARSGVATECRIFDTNAEYTSSSEFSQTVNASGQWVAATTKIGVKAQGVAFSDDFGTGSTPDPTKWVINTLGVSGVATATVTGGRMRLTSPSVTPSAPVVRSKDVFTLSGRSLTLQIPAQNLGGAGIHELSLTIGDWYDEDYGLNTIRIGHGTGDGSGLTHRLERHFNGTITSVATRTFAAGDWYRLTESGGTVTVETSTNGTSWSTWGTISVGSNPPVGWLWLTWGQAGGSGTPYIEFDNITLT